MMNIAAIGMAAVALTLNRAAMKTERSRNPARPSSSRNIVGRSPCTQDRHAAALALVVHLRDVREGIHFLADVVARLPAAT